LGPHSSGPESYSVFLTSNWDESSYCLRPGRVGGEGGHSDVDSDADEGKGGETVKDKNIDNDVNIDGENRKNEETGMKASEDGADGAEQGTSDEPKSNHDEDGDPSSDNFDPDQD
jgi:hypothetical protein